MKTGIIVYISGNAPEKFNFDKHMLTERLRFNVDKVELVSAGLGHFDIPDAWWALTAKGMNLIFCMMARFSETGELEFSTDKLRLCG